MNIHIQCIIPLLLALEICDVQFPLETIVPMSTNINAIKRFEYVYYCKIIYLLKGKVQTYVTNLICTCEKL